MSEPNTSPNSWQQLTADMSVSLGRALQRECASWRIMRKHLLRAQTEVLKGFLEVVEMRLARVEGKVPPSSEKIPVD